jgi:membrane-bound lytic murein transglycosylase D
MADEGMMVRLQGDTKRIVHHMLARRSLSSCPLSVGASCALVTEHPQYDRRKTSMGNTKEVRFRTAPVVILFLALAFILGSCSSSKNVAKNSADTVSAVVKPTDPFAGLDETAEIDPAILEERLEAARQEWLRALAAEQRKDKNEVVKRFENAIDILNRLIYYPNTSENKDFQELSRSVIEDYEKFVSDIDVLPPNASIFAFRQKFNEEIAKIDIRKLNIPKPPDIKTTQVPLTMNAAVEQSIAYFMQGNGRTYMTKWLGRSGKFFPMMRRIFKEEGTPEELIYLSMVESGLNTTVVSRAQAVGLWQFIQGTGAAYGLKVNWWLDHRRDPEKATRAAAKHLKDLYRAMGDWHLALSCYNCSMTRIKRCMAETDDSTYWGIRPCLPKETQNYVPLYIAATIIAMDPARYGFTEINYDKPLEFDTVRVFEAVDINAIGMAAGVSGLEIKNLNPELLQPSTPPKEMIAESGYVVRVPVGQRDKFYAEFPKLTPEEKRPWLVHSVARGESLRSIARTYGITSAQLADYNNLSANERVRSGMKLRVPMSVMAPGAAVSDDDIASKESNVTAPTPKKSSKITHRVKKGETVNSIADRYGVRAADVRNWNNLSYRKKLKKGQSLAIYVERNKPAQNVAAKSDGKTHKVQRGETLGKIADEYGVSVADLKAWNGKKVSKGVKSGQVIKIAAPENLAATTTSTESEGKARTHKVRPGETMTSIAKSYGTTAEKLAEWNGGKDASTLQAGDVLKVYGDNKTPALGDSDNSTKAAKKTYHKVRKGETLFSIADKYNVQVSSLKEANDLTSNKIAAGKRLVIPVE